MPPLDAQFEAMLRARCSTREYSGEPIALPELSHLLSLAYGITGQALLDDGETLRTRRPVPSGGGLYPIELYVVALRVAGLDAGLYHYQPLDHVLECLRSGSLQAEIEHAVLYPEVVAQASAVVLMGAVFHRHRFKYGERGYRFTLLDAGHIGQNLSLVATALGLGAVGLGGYLDDATNRLVGMNGVDEAVVYAMCIGRPARPTPGTSESTE